MLLYMQAVAAAAVLQLVICRFTAADASVRVIRSACVPAKLELYVDSSSGNDAASGFSVSNALRSIAAAQGRVVNALGSSCPPLSISVLLSNSAPHVLADSITVNQRVPVPIEYKTFSANGVAHSKLAEVTTAIRLSSSCFKPIASGDPNFNQIGSNLANSVYVCDMGHDAGLTNDDFTMCELGFRVDSFDSEVSACTEPQVYVQPKFNDPVKRLHYARWPNVDDNSHIPADYLKHHDHQTGTVPIASIVGNPGGDYVHSNPKVNFTITSGISENQAQLWSREKNLFIDGVLLKSWAWTRVKVNYVSFKAPAVTIQLGRPFIYAITNTWYNLFSVQNALSELDTPQEYFVDTKSTTSPRLYMYSDKNSIPSSVLISGKKSTKPMFIISDTQNITFSHIAFNVSSNAAIYGQNVTGLTVSGCTFQNLGQEGIKLLSSSDSKISSSVFTDIGNSAMLLDGSANSPSILATDNSISRVSWYNKVYTAGITTSGYSVVIRRNILREGPHAGIYLRGNSKSHVIEGNDIGYFVQNFHDFGSIYFFAGAIRECNHLIRNNYVHDGGDNCLIYLDNLSSYNAVHGNLVTRARVGIYLDGGIHNRVTNNLIHDAFVHPHLFIGLEPHTNCTSFNFYNGDSYLVPKSLEHSRLPKDYFGSLQHNGNLNECNVPPPGYSAFSTLVIDGLSALTLNPDEDRKAFSPYFQFPVDPFFVAQPLTIYVDAVQGSDSNAGTTQASPINTISAAQSKIAQLISTCHRNSCPPKITVLLSNEAPHVIQSTIQISNISNVPITYSSYGSTNRSAQITTAYTLPGSCFKDVPKSDPNWNLIASRIGLISVCDLGTVPSTSNLRGSDLKTCELGVGIDGFGDKVSSCVEPQVFVSRANDPSTLNRQWLSRWSNMNHFPSTATINKVVGNPGVDGASGPNPVVTFEMIGLSSSVALMWAQEKQPLIDGFLTTDKHAWNRVNVSVLGYNAATKAATLRISRGLGSKVDSSQRFNNFFALNLISELDSPEEYFLDTYHDGAPKLYLVSPKNGRPVSAVISGTSRLDHLFNIVNSSKVTFSNIAFQISSGGAIYGNQTSDITITGCLFDKIGKDALRFRDSTRVTISKSTFNDIGDTAVNFIGGKDSQILANSINNVGLLNRANTYGISSATDNLVISGNTMTQGDDNGILVDALNNTISYNQISHFGHLPDTYAVAVVGGLQNVAPNHSIVRNYIRDVEMSILLESTSGINITSNLFTRFDTMVSIRNGANNAIQNNILHSGRLSYHFTGSNCDTYNLFKDNEYVLAKSQTARNVASATFVAVINGRNTFCKVVPGYSNVRIEVADKLQNPSRNAQEDCQGLSSFWNLGLTRFGWSACSPHS